MNTPELSPDELAFRAECGDAGAQFQLGMLFLLGERVEQNLESAHRWIARAAEANHPSARILAQRLAAIHPEKPSEPIGAWSRLGRRVLRALEWSADQVRRAAQLARLGGTSDEPPARADRARVRPAPKAASLVDAA
jgi:TPR repeat protein